MSERPAAARPVSNEPDDEISLSELSSTDAVCSSELELEVVVEKETPMCTPAQAVDRQASKEFEARIISGRSGARKSKEARPSTSKVQSTGKSAKAQNSGATTKNVLRLSSDIKSPRPDWLTRRYCVLYKRLQDSKDTDNLGGKCIDHCFHHACCCLDACLDACESRCKCTCTCCTCPDFEMKEELTKARTLGIKTAFDTVCSDMFTATPIGSVVREIAIYGGFLIMAALFINVCLIFLQDVAGNSNINNIPLWEVVCSGLGLLLSLVDLVIDLVCNICTCYKNCASSKNCCNEFRWHTDTLLYFTDSVEIGCCKRCKNTSSPLDDPSRPEDHKKTCTCKKRLHTVNFHLPDKPSEAETAAGCCMRCGMYVIMDIVRYIAIPTLAYPLLLMAMFQFLSNLIAHQMDDITTSLISFTLTGVSQFGFVYLVRAFIFTGMIYSLQKVQTGGAGRKELMTSSSCFQHYFLLAAFGHMFVELTMIAVIGIRFYYEYQAFQDASYVLVSPVFMPSVQLWYMMFCAYFAAPLGLALFLITHYYWTQRFFIKFFLDVLLVLKKKVEDQGAYVKFINDNKFNFRENYDEVDESGVCKFTYSFVSPTIIVLCFFYCSLIIGFFICAFLEANIYTTNIGVFGFYVAAAVVATLVNIHASAIFLVWVLIFVLTAIVIVVVVAAIVAAAIAIFGILTALYFVVIVLLIVCFPCLYIISEIKCK